jgi:hypothetical protein
MRPMAAGHPAPPAGFVSQMLAPLGCEGVEPGLAIIRRDAPFGFDPPLRFHALQCRIQRAMVHQESLVGIRLDRARDSLSVLRPEDEDAKDQEVEGALQQGEAALFILC